MVKDKPASIIGRASGNCQQGRSTRRRSLIYVTVAPHRRASCVSGNHGCNAKNTKNTKQQTGIDMNILTRQAGLADLECTAALFDAYRQFYGQAPDLGAARAFIAERLALLESVIYLAEDDKGTAIGFTQLYPSFSSVSARRIWILNDLFVDAQVRASGAGKALLDAAKRHAVATGAKRLVLSTAVDNPAKKLYEAQNYQRDKSFHHYSLELE